MRVPLTHHQLCTFGESRLTREVLLLDLHQLVGGELHFEVDDFTPRQGDDHLPLIAGCVCDDLAARRSPLVHATPRRDVPEALRVNLQQGQAPLWQLAKGSLPHSMWTSQTPATGLLQTPSSAERVPQPQLLAITGMGLQRSMTRACQQELVCCPVTSWLAPL